MRDNNPSHRTEIIHMKKVFIAKSGIEHRFWQFFFLLPFSLIINFILWVILSKKAFVFILTFVIINLLWFIHNSFVVFDNGKLKFKNLVGITVTVDCCGAVSPKIISSAEFLKINRNVTKQNPISENCTSLLLSVKNVILFQDKNYKTVAVCAYKCEELLVCIENFASEPAAEKPMLQKYTGKRTERYFIKMPFKSHLNCYFRNYIITIICPAVISAIMALAFSKIVNFSYYGLFFFILFIIHSVFIYVFNTVSVIQNKFGAAIKLTCYAKEATPAILYQYIKDVRYITSPEEQQNIMNMKQNIIKTPHPDYIWKNVIYIELENGNAALLSVNHHKKLYQNLKQYLEKKENRI